MKYDLWQRQSAIDRFAAAPSGKIADKGKADIRVIDFLGGTLLAAIPIEIDFSVNFNVVGIEIEIGRLLIIGRFYISGLSP